MKPLACVLARPLASVAVLALVACGGPSDEVRLARAQTLVDARNPAGAILEMKALLQQRPDSGKARLLFGKALLAKGDASAAETELKRAMERGVPLDDVLPDLAQALLAQRKLAQLSTEFGKTRLTRPGPAAAYLATLAEARAMAGSTTEASQLVSEALALRPDQPEARLLEARLSAAQGDTALAVKQVDALLAKSAPHADAWVFKAQLLRAQGAPGEAIIHAYRQGLQVVPDAVAAHAGLIGHMMHAGDFAAAHRQHMAMAKVLPAHPRTIYFDALLAAQRGDNVRARELAQAALRRMPEDADALLLAGRAEVVAGAPGQAEILLAKAVTVAPQRAEPRRLLGQVLLGAGQTERALAVLQPLTKGAHPDADALLLSAQAALRSGDSSGAERAFQRAASLRPDDARVKLARTLAGLNKGRDDVVMAELQRLVDVDPTNIETAMAVISAQLARHRDDAALANLDAVARRLPTLAWPDDLRGRIALRLKDPAAARRHFERALTKDADHYPSTAMLVGMDLADKQPTQALGRLEGLLKRRPEHLEASLARIEIQARMGSSTRDRRTLLEEVVRRHPAQAAAHQALIDHLIGIGDIRQAQAAAGAAVVALPDQVDLLERLGRAQKATGEWGQAETTFRRLIALQGDRAPPLLRLAEVQLLRHDPDAARASILRARDLEPGDLDALRAALALALREGRPDDAMTLAREAQARRPHDAIGLLLQGDVQFARQRWVEAQAAYRQALARSPRSAEAAQRLHAALAEGGKRAEADDLAARWLAAHPDDPGFQHHVAAASLARGDWARAKVQYEDLLKRRPDDLVALNNLAVSLAKSKTPGAVAMAEAAVKRAPARAELLDTLSLAYASENQTAAAVEWQRKAVELAPQDGRMRLRLASLYLRVGDKARAGAELDLLARLGSGFAGHKEVAHLRQEAGLAASGASTATTETEALMPSARSAAPSTQGAPAEPSEVLGVFTGTGRLLAALTLGGLLLGIPVLLLVAALRPAVLRVERAVIVGASADSVFDLLQDLRSWEAWSTLEPFHASAGRSFLGMATGQGAVCTWANGARHEKGYLQILTLSAPLTLVVEMKFEQPRETNRFLEFTLTPTEDAATQVQATLSGPAPYVMRLAGILRGTGWRLGQNLQADLMRLKARAETLTPA